jgi:DNA-binding CsgD family transcriptional regulator
MHTGTAPSDYARQHLISLNTVYTHLRRIKDEDRLQAHARTDPQA